MTKSSFTEWLSCTVFRHFSEIFRNPPKSAEICGTISTFFGNFPKSSEKVRTIPLPDCCR